jgi:invasion protein IalB
MRRSLTIAAAAALVAGAHVASAQNIRSSKDYGGWTVQCTVDGMTDKTTCILLGNGTEVGGREMVFLSWRDTDKGAAVRLVSSRLPLRNALARVDTHKPIEMRACNERAQMCMAQLEQEGELAAQIQAGRKLLLRVDAQPMPRDFVFNLDGLDEARAEFERLRTAAAQPTAIRPVDSLERGQIARIAAEKKADEERRHAAEINKLAEAARTRCDKAFDRKDYDHKSCTATATMCANNPIPRNGEEFRSCFDAVFPSERFTPTRARP